MIARDLMDPGASPNEVPTNAGVRRVNNLPVYIIGIVIILFLTMIGLVAADRAKQQHKLPAPRDEKAISTTLFANQIAGINKEGIIPPDKDPPPLPGTPKSDAILIARSDDLDMPPLPPGGSASKLDQRLEDENTRIRQAKLQQFEEAVKAKTNVQISAPRSADSSPLASNTTAGAAAGDTAARLAQLRQQMRSTADGNVTVAYKDRLQHAQTELANDSDAGSARSLQATASANPGSKDIEQFTGSSSSDRWRLDSTLEAPSSAYILRTGFVLPAILISGINAELPGQIIAQVSQDVFDTPTGKWKLIPQGSRLIGRYASEVVFGQSRVLIAWQRIVFPDGKALDIGAMPGGDSAGYAGVTDQVNNHYLRLFGSAFLMSGVTAGIALSQPQSNAANNSRQTTSGAISEALGQQLGQVTAQMIAKNFNASPTLEIRPGYRFNVMVTKDLVFARPYQPFDYEAKGEAR